MNQIVKIKLSQLPDEPGCYLMKNHRGKIIYVGKAKNLKNRVSSYFHGAHDTKTEKMVSLIEDFDYIVTNTEMQSLILEANLIKQHQPKYNILLKDDKSYPFIRLIKEPLVHIKVVRDKKRIKNALYFGPFPNAKSAYDVVKLIEQHYPTQKCFPLKKKLCLYYHMNQCLGSCEKKIDNHLNEQMFQDIQNILRGNQDKLREKIEKKMLGASEELNFESAQVYKNQLESLSYILQPQLVVSKNHQKIDIFNIYQENDFITIVGLFFNEGKMLSKQMVFQSLIGTVSETLETFIVQYYLDNPLPKEVVVPLHINAALLTEVLKIKVISVNKGEKKQWLDLAFKNAQMMMIQKLELNKHMMDQNEVGLSKLKSLLSLSSLETVELIDISHSAGEMPVGASVWFDRGVPDKKQYRLYHVHHENNDVMNMKEMIERKCVRYQKQELELPDCLIVDGGKGQVNGVLEVLSQFQINIPVIGLVKNDKHQTRSIIFKNEEIELDPQSPFYFFLLLMQDEVHRFAISNHQKMKRKKELTSILDEVRGLGLSRKNKLLAHFGSLRSILRSSVSELQKVLGDKIGEMVYNELMVKSISNATSIAIIDSGLGGYTIFRQCQKDYPLVNFTFLADQKNAPFGNKSYAELLEIGKSFCEYCLSHQIVDVIVGCNTLSSTVLNELKNLYPTLNLISIIEVTLSGVNEKTKGIQVLATKATIESHVYQKLIHQMFPNVQIKETASLDLARMIEELAVEEDIKAHLDLLIDKEFETLVLGCTHYPLVKYLIQHHCIVDALVSVDRLMNQCLSFPMGSGSVLTTGDPLYFEKQIKQIFKENIRVRGIKL